MAMHMGYFESLHKVAILKPQHKLSTPIYTLVQSCTDSNPYMY